MSKRQQLREKRQRQTRQQRFIVIGGIVVVAVAVVGWLIYQSTKPLGPIVSVTATPPPNSDGSAIGSPDAKVTVTVYEDFQCPVCKRLHESIEPQLLTEYVYPGKVRYDYRHLIVIGNESWDAAKASECAGEQGWFWPYHDILFANQTAENVGDFTVRRLKAMAGELKLDQAKFDSCLDSNKFEGLVNADVASAKQIGLNSTPVTVITGASPIVGVEQYETYKQAIDRALAAAGQ